MHEFQHGGVVVGLNELAPILTGLDRADKLRVIQLLIQELAKEEGALLSGNSYPIWSPYASFEAADVLLEALNTEQQHV
jgi:hypothetical protein